MVLFKTQEENHLLSPPLPPKKGISAKNTHVGHDLQKQDFGFGLPSCPGRAAASLVFPGCEWLEEWEL